uniref:Secreted protein n=1 Tax=Felis catus TaxID=9685 RepID=A0ABI7YYY0_FELCA
MSLSPTPAAVLTVRSLLGILFLSRTCFKLQVFCNNCEKPATQGKPCPKVHKPVLGLTHFHYISFSAPSLFFQEKKNGKLGFKHNGKC